MGEIELQKERLKKEAGRIACYESLSNNSDFKVFKKDLIDDKIEVLLRELEESTDKEVDIKIKELYKCLKGIQRLFDDTIAHKEQNQKALEELEKIK